MPLITTTDLLRLTDKSAAVYRRWASSIGLANELGSDGWLATQALARVVSGSPDYDVQQALSASLNSAAGQLNRGDLGDAVWGEFVGALDGHLAAESDDEEGDDSTLDGFLTDANATPYAVLVAADFAELYFAIKGEQLTATNVMQPAVHPYAGAADGLGRRAVGGSYVAGTARDPDYAEVTGSVEVITNFSGGSAPPTVTVAGTDNAGATGTTWTATLVGNNPTAAVATTITPAVTAMARQTVAVASATGIVVGSLVKVNAGLIDEEVVVVEVVAGSNLTACFEKAHLAGAALTGFTTAALTPSVAGRRIASISGITIGVTGHAAGAVRVCGVQDRGYRMD